jgi:hypothetical protein
MVEGAVAGFVSRARTPSPADRPGRARAGDPLRRREWAVEPSSVGRTTTKEKLSYE